MDSRNYGYIMALLHMIQCFFFGPSINNFLWHILELYMIMHA